MAPEAEPIVFLIKPMQRCNDLLEFSLDPLLLPQCHLLLLHGVHPSQATDRLIKTHGLCVLSASLCPALESLTHPQKLFPERLLLLVRQST
jgi:hypothetical protein